MYTINTSIKIKAPKSVVFSVIKNLGSFPSFMHYIKEIKVTKKSDRESISKWSVDVEGADVNWEERDLYYNKEMMLSFSMIKGDYNIYKGRWVLSETDGKAILAIETSVDWDIPSFEKVIGPILQQKTKKIIRGMLAAVKLKAEKNYKETLAKVTK